HPVLDLAEDPAEARVEGVFARLDRIGGLERGADALGHADAAQQPGALLRGELLPRLRQVGAERLRGRLEDAAVPAALLRELAARILGEERAAEQRQRRVDEDLLLDDAPRAAEPEALGAGAEVVVEAEVARRELAGRVPAAVVARGARRPFEASPVLEQR